jgi:hypothetical protein
MIRRPIYLERSSSILFAMLKNASNYTFKKQYEKSFISTRLDLLDQQYCLEIDLNLWQSYLDIGLQQDRWPVSCVLLKLYSLSFL